MGFNQACRSVEGRSTTELCVREDSFVCSNCHCNFVPTWWPLRPSKLGLKFSFPKVLVDGGQDAAMAVHPLCIVQPIEIRDKLRQYRPRRVYWLHTIVNMCGGWIKQTRAWAPDFCGR